MKFLQQRICNAAWITAAVVLTVTLLGNSEAKPEQAKHPKKATVENGIKNGQWMNVTMSGPPGNPSDSPPETGNCLMGTKVHPMDKATFDKTAQSDFWAFVSDLNPQLFGGKPCERANCPDQGSCGRCLEVRRNAIPYREKVAMVRVIDACPHQLAGPNDPCSSRQGHIILGPGAFKHLESRENVNVQARFVPCSSGPLGPRK